MLLKLTRILLRFQRFLRGLGTCPTCRGVVRQGHCLKCLLSERDLLRGTISKLELRLVCQNPSLQALVWERREAQSKPGGKKTAGKGGKK